MATQKELMASVVSKFIALTGNTIEQWEENRKTERIVVALGGLTEQQYTKAFIEAKGPDLLTVEEISAMYKDLFPAEATV